MPRGKRRSQGEGSVFQRKDGRWVMQIWLGDKYKQVYVKSEKEGIKKLREAQRELEQGILPTGPDQTLKQYIEYWLEEVHKPTIRLSSYVKYRKIINSYIIPILGDMKLQKLTPQHINSFYRQKEKDGLQSSTINTIHGVLHRALDNAVKWGYIARNVCDSVSPPRIVKHEIKPLTMEQASKLLEVARGQRLEMLLTLALTTGMRRGELLALRWSDVDLESGNIQVRRTVDIIPKHGYVENEPKTARSRRMIVLAPFAVDMLKQHHVQQLELRLKAGSNWQEKNLVFTGLHGSYLNPNHLPEMMEKVLTEAGLPHIRFHDLRHSAATLLLSMGVHLKVVQEILGHSNISMTADTYSHVLPSMQQEAVGKWGDKLKPNDSENR